MTSQFLCLPPELLVCIFSHLTPRDLYSLRYSCCKLRNIILGDRTLQRRLQSLELCMKDYSPSSSSESTLDFLKNLEDMENTFSTFGPGKEVSARTELGPFQSFHQFEFSGDTETAFLLRSGYLIQLRKKEDPGWVYMDLSPKHDLHEHTPALEWKGVPLKSNGIMGWALDVNQDLVAVSFLPYEDPEGSLMSMSSRELFGGYRRGNIQVYLMQFTSGKNHKSATKAVVRLDPLGWYDMEFKTHIAIMGGYLVVLLAHYTCLNGPGYERTGKYQTVYLVDWVKGHVVHRWPGTEDKYFPFLASISETTFVLGLKGEWALELFQITKENGASRICSRRKLELPAVQPGTHIILEKFDETPSCPGRPSAIRSSTIPFSVPTSDSILVFYVSARSRSGEKQTIIFSVFKSTLHNLTVTTRRTSKWWWKRRAPYFVPWDKWGPELTRWIDFTDFPMIRELSGARCVMSDTSTGRVRMLDFNPERLPWMEDWIKRRTEETGGRDWVVVTSPTTIVAGEVFQYNVESKLPYCELKKIGVEKKAGSRFLIDDKWVVLIRPG